MSVPVVQCADCASVSLSVRPRACFTDPKSCPKLMNGQPPTYLLTTSELHKFLADRKASVHSYDGH